jgi:gamma-glutamyltranspeptidase/glutathione hydrolase
VRALLSGLALLLGGCAVFPNLDERALPPTPKDGVVVCDEPVAAQAGLSMLERGGNAVDAAVATAFTLAVTLPEAGNLGGGGFAIFCPHDERAGDDARYAALALDFRETAPAALDAAMFRGPDGALDPELANRSALAAGVPGSVAGLYELHRRAGRLSWSEVLRPAIRAARGGEMSASLRWRLDDDEMRARIVAGGGGDAFYPDGAPPPVGAPFPQPALARTLERIAREGPAGFYRGATAQALVDGLAARGGVMTLADLDGYRTVPREPLRGWFRGSELLTMPPPSSGGVVLLQALSILDGFPLDQEREATLAARGDPPGAPGISGRTVHWWIEALRRAFADRAEHLGDPDFVDVPVDALLSPDWIAARRISIGERADPRVEPMDAVTAGPVGAAGSDTTHVAVIDRKGNAVSLTTTLNSNFGTGIYLPDVGFFMNDELDDFALQTGVPNQFGLVGGEANALAPRKRPLSSMTPVVVRDGGTAATIVLGARGGPRIITAVFLTILRTEVYEQSLEDAQRAPRLHQQWNPGKTYFEPGWDPRVLQELRNRGHEIEVTTKRGAEVQGLRLRVGGVPQGVADPRNPLGAVASERDGVRTAREACAGDARWGKAMAGEGRDLDWGELEW